MMIALRVNMGLNLKAAFKLSKQYSTKRDAAILSDLLMNRNN